jgi:hypothetical protein
MWTGWMPRRRRYITSSRFIPISVVTSLFWRILSAGSTSLLLLTRHLDSCMARYCVLVHRKQAVCATHARRQSGRFLLRQRVVYLILCILGWDWARLPILVRNSSTGVRALHPGRGKSDGSINATILGFPFRKGQVYLSIRGPPPGALQHAHMLGS